MLQVGAHTLQVGARLALAVKGLSYRKRTVLIPGENFEPWYIRINPAGLVPVLVHDGKVICDCTRIVDYLDTVFHDSGRTPEMVGKTTKTLPFFFSTRFQCECSSALSALEKPSSSLETECSRDSGPNDGFSRADGPLDSSSGSVASPSQTDVMLSCLLHRLKFVGLSHRSTQKRPLLDAYYLQAKQFAPFQ
ncbi:ganglioside-induced differentiation-associated protein 1-like [Branchiostoma lanceolatum]|uniref:ganglioside-induced differentiation-associated protein 1-like n=1 Tax=Branchiostoma lanceolatum TaxID=7740 RepID=UPI003454F0AF